MHPIRFCQFLIFFGLLEAYVTSADRKNLHRGREAEKNQRRADVQIRAHKQLRTISKHLLKTLDTSCKQIPPPSIKNGKLLRLKKRKSEIDTSKRLYLVAEFKCHPGYEFGKFHSGKMFCSRSKWIGRIPLCEPTSMLDINGYLSDAPIDINETVLGDDEDYEEKDYDDGDYDDEDDYEDEVYTEEKDENKQSTSKSLNIVSEIAKENINTSESKFITEENKNNNISLPSGISGIKFNPRERIDSNIKNGDESESYDDEYDEEDYEDYEEENENKVESEVSTTSTTTVLSSTSSILSSTIPTDSIVRTNKNENKTENDSDINMTTTLTTPIISSGTSEIGLVKIEAVDERIISQIFENNDEDSKKASNNFIKKDSSKKENSNEILPNEFESMTNEVLDRTVEANRRTDLELNVTKNIDEYEEHDYDEYEEGSESSTPATTTTSSSLISPPDSFNIDKTNNISSSIGGDHENENKFQFNRHNGIDTNEISTIFTNTEVSTQNYKKDTETDSETYDEEEYDDEDYDEEYEERTTISTPTTTSIHLSTEKSTYIVVPTEKNPFVLKAEHNDEEENVIRRYDSETSSKRYEGDVSEKNYKSETTEKENTIFNNHILKENNNRSIIFSQNRNALVDDENYDEISTTTTIPTEAPITNEIPITTEGSWDEISEIDSKSKEIENRNDVNYNDIYDGNYYKEKSDKTQSSITHQEKYKQTHSRDFGKVADFNQSKSIILYDTTTRETSTADGNSLKKTENLGKNKEYDDDDYDEGMHPEPNNDENDKFSTTTVIPTEAPFINEIPLTTRGSWTDISEIDSNKKDIENRNDVNYNDIYDDDYYEENGDRIPSVSNTSVTHGEKDKPTHTKDFEKVVENANFNQSINVILFNTTTEKTLTANENSSKEIEKIDKDDEYDDDVDDDDYDEEKHPELNKEESMVVENEVDKCEDGYISDQNGTCTDIDECNPDTNPCSEICENTIGSYTCSCSKGYKLSSADIHVCQDIDECLENPCSHICKNLEGYYVCDCPTGLSLQNASCVNLTCSHGETKINGKLQCTCPSGYVLGFDNRTCEDVDECLLFNDCSHNCQNNEGSYSCSCREGFILENGKICVDIDECQGKHGCSQVCENTPGSFKCACHDGYEHDMLTNSCVDIDECDERRDLDECNQICINYNGGYECGCRSGFKLASDDSTCEDVNECSSNNGNCSHICTNLQGSFTCECKQNYILERDNKTCTIVNPCLEENGGCSHQCINNNGVVECRCPLGHILENKECFLSDPCVIDNGKCSHICVNANGAVRCECPRGYELEDQLTCYQINPCTRNNGNCSHFCEFVDGHINCLCPGLYSLRNETHCVEINPCLENNGGCSHFCHFENHKQTCSCPLTHELHNQTYCFEKNPCFEENGGCSDICVYSNGTMSCGCPENYYLEGKICYRIDPCLIGNGGCSHECFSDEDGNVQCSCPGSLHLQTDGKSCIPNDPCLLNNGYCSHICDSTTGSIMCSCPEGYTLRNSTHCIEYNPCSVKNGGCTDICENDLGKARCSCPDHHNLVNKTTCLRANPCFINNGGCSHECVTEGNKVICLCREGYQLEGKKCLLINPCDHKNGGCSHVCSSINGQVVCKCPPDFELINKTCFKINPCSINNGECSHGCTNIRGFAKCTCPPGYKLFGKKCMDEDPCVKNNGGCSHVCRNKEGKRECSCPPGYLLRPNKRVCKEVNECRVNRGGCSHGCKNLPGSYQCTCPHGLKLDNSRNKTCIDIDECLIENGKCEMICRNFKGGHKCDCPEGYTLQRDRRSCRLGNAEQCRVPPPPKNGILRCLDHRADYGSFVPSGTKCNAYCNEGFKLIGQSQRLCNSAGTWENMEPRCVVATCPKLPPIQNGWYLPGVCNSGRTYPGESCEIYCRKGFIAKPDVEKYVCDSNMQWMPSVRPEQLRDVCVRNLPDVNIRCPKNGHIEFILPPGQRHTFVKIPRPETNIDWNFVTSQPSWATRLENTLPAGRTEVRFTAVSPSDFNSSASCHLVINVLDKELPKTMRCPENIERIIGKDEHMQIVHWREPEFHDNVGIATVYKSRESGSEFGLGLHHITYVASDEAGNRAFCHFSINIRDDLQSEESNIIKQHPSTYTNHQTAGKYRAVLICPSGVQYMSSPPDSYNNMLTSEAGCYWRHVKVTRPMQPQSFKVPPRVYSQSRLPDQSRSDRRVFFKWSR